MHFKVLCAQVLLLLFFLTGSCGRQKGLPRIRPRRILQWRQKFNNRTRNIARVCYGMCVLMVLPYSGSRMHNICNAKLIAAKEIQSCIISKQRDGYGILGYSHATLTYFLIDGKTINSELRADLVGCFELQNPRSPLQRIPEDPNVLDTRFYLFRRDISFSEPEILYYNDNGTSLDKSSFNYAQSLKVFIHGYTGKWDNSGSLNATHAYLKIYDCNVLLMDWSTAARGPQYAMAAANTEVSGRQLGVLLGQLIHRGLHATNIHLIGFSLGAHVAACASEFLKTDNHLIGRITGLDASSPLFRHHHIREKSKKLDKGDAVFVDVLHTDASPVFVDGFGLWDPIGHIDFFANGGQEQPGCVDRHPSVVVTHLDGALTKDTACSHIRAFELFSETIISKGQTKNQCKFIAFKCPGGLPTFQRGQCFPRLEKADSPLAIDLKYKSDVSVLGEDAAGGGVMFFSTRSSSPFCGTQLQTSVKVSLETPPTLGVLMLLLQYDNNHLKFQMYCELTDPAVRNLELNSLATADYDNFNLDARKMQAVLKFVRLELQNNTQTASINLSDFLIIENISVRDMFGDSWDYHGEDIKLQDIKNDSDGIAVKLKKKT